MDGAEVLPQSKLADISILLPQEPFVFKLTLAENVAMSEHYDLRRVEEALRRANLWSFVEELPNGLRTRMGDEGTGLWVGQKQRLAIARALYSDCDVLIMDEPNSSLDSENSNLVMREVFELFNDKTIIMITHCEDLLPYFNRILALKNGKLFQRRVPELVSLPQFPITAGF